MTFIPKPIRLPGCPDLTVFPENVTFTGCLMDGFKQMTGISVYKPIPSSMTRARDHLSLLYENEYGRDDLLKIVRDTRIGAYSAFKYLSGRLSLCSEGGADWNAFFILLTAGGLQQGEGCRRLGE